MWYKDMSLTDVLCKKALPTGQTVSPFGFTWFIFTIRSKWSKNIGVYRDILKMDNRKSKALGTYPELSLKSARRLHMILSINSKYSEV